MRHRVAAVTGADVIVVGGGPAGASTAFGLARTGARVMLLERAHFPRPKPCAECLSPQASRILADMGALDAVERAGAVRLAGMIVRAPDGARIHGRFAAAHGYRAFNDHGLALRRELLDPILVDCARRAGVEVYEGVRVVDLDRDAAGRVTGVVTLSPDGARAVRSARVVVGADGLHSVVAQRLGVARRRPWPRRIALTAHFRGVDGMGAFGEMHVARDGYVGLASVDGGLVNVSAVFPHRAAAAIARDRAAFLDDWLSRQPQLAPRFAHAQRADDVRAVGPFASHARRAWAPGALLVGDAADFFDPFTGEGIYSALRGGELAAIYARAALAATSPAEADTALAAYDRARRREFGGKWIVERVIGAVIAWAPLINRVARACEAHGELADLLVGVAGDFVPPREVMRPSILFTLFARPLPAARAAPRA
ncbi:MAG TPA: FAD-dependent oxidoreductase [Gemmatimonadaceae bacterium]|nr:FAD-dependent oxidoreductase [Gemmatimonadaceae bacterium]